MYFTFNWKTGLLAAIGTVIFGLGFFIFIGSQVDYLCKNETNVSGGCRVYNGFNTIIGGYSDFWRQFFAPRCVGGSGPDDCIGPDIGIMFLTLAGAGFIVGGTSRKKKPLPPK